MILYKEKPSVIYPVLLSGKQGSGKSTTADLVVKYLEQENIPVIRYKFAQVLYEMHDQVLQVMKAYGIQVPVKDGRLLQLLGTEWGRETYGRDIWVNCALGKYEAAMAQAPTTGQFKQDYVFLIDDLRFKNELAAFDFGYRVRLECAKDIRKARCPAWRDTDDHSSETDLDDSLGLFNEVLDTELLSVDAVAGQIVQGIKDRYFSGLPDAA